MKNKEDLEVVLGDHLANLTPKKFFENVAFFDTDNITLSQALFRDPCNNIKYTLRLFKEDEYLSVLCYFLTPTSDELWFLRTNAKQVEVNLTLNM